MTVNVTDITSGPYTGNGITIEFSYDFTIEDETQLQVFETTDLGVVSTLVLNTDYTVTGVGVEGGGNVVLTAPLTTDYDLFIVSDYKLTQLSSLDSQGAYFSDIHEAAFDKLTYIVLQQQRQSGLTVKFPDSYSGSASTELPTPSAGLGVKWNATADALENTLIDPDAAVTAAAASAAAALVSENAAAADLVQTNLDQIQTTADAAATAADLVQTNLDQIQTTADAAATAADLVQTNLDQIQTTADAAATAADVLTTNADAATTTQDAIDTAADVLTTNADAATTTQDAIDTAADASAAAASAVAAAASASEGLYSDVVAIAFGDSPYTMVTAQDGDMIKVDTSGGNVVINLPSLTSEADDYRCAVIKETGDANTITVQRQGADTINGGTSLVIDSQYQAYNFVGDQSALQWLAISATIANAFLVSNNLSEGNATTMRTNLGLVIGTNVQAYDATIVVDADIGSTVQGYDADTAKLDVAQSFTAQQTFKEYAETQYSLTGTDIDPANGSLQYKTLSANTTFTESLVDGQSVTLMIDDGTAYTITWPTTTWVGGAAPTLPTTGYAVIELWQINAVLYGLHSGDA
jgi:hypothetical protein